MPSKKWPEARSSGLLSIICYSEFELNGEFVNVQTFICNSFGMGEKENVMQGSDPALYLNTKSFGLSIKYKCLPWSLV